MTILDRQIATQNGQMDFDDLVDELSNITADLVSYREHEDCIRKLLETRKGDWLDLFALCSGISTITHRFENIRDSLDGPLWTTWLEHKEPEYNEDYCVILFFAPDLLWSNAIIYNRKRLLTA